MRHHIGASLSHLPLFILSELVVEREELLREGFHGDVLGHISQVLGKCATYACVLIEAHSSELVHHEALIDGLAHVTGYLVKKLDG